MCCHQGIVDFIAQPVSIKNGTENELQSINCSLKPVICLALHLRRVVWEQGQQIEKCVMESLVPRKKKLNIYGRNNGLVMN